MQSSCRILYVGSSSTFSTDFPYAGVRACLRPIILNYDISASKRAMKIRLKILRSFLCQGYDPQMGEQIVHPITCGISTGKM